ncbi:VOC family protein [Candidatus Gottesmanbacteria bacterium]|nr:VOC family protein [Candidatus Gottesmanbacteria bacterium]
MVKGLEGILLGSANAKQLADFYKNKVGLKLTMEAEVGEKGEGLYVFEMKGCSLYIIDHSKVKGKNNQPGRFIFNLEVDNIEKEVKRVKTAKVKLIKDIYHVEDYGHVATFEDVDGNYFQLVQVKA